MKPFTVAILVVIGLIVGGLFIDILEPAYGFFGKVDTGYVGVVTTFGRIHENTLQSGFHVKHFFDRITQLNCRTQKGELELVAFSSDIQQTTLQVTVNFNVTPEVASNLFKTVGTSYVNTLIKPRILEDTKIVVAEYTAESLIENRERLSSEIASLLRDDLEPHGITVTAVSIENMDFTDAFESAVEAKQVATQQKLTAQTEEDKKTIQEKAQAERDKIKADADAYAVKTRAEAEAEANKLVSASLTDELIRYNQALLWDGHLPTTYIGGEGAIPVVDITKE